MNRLSLIGIGALFAASAASAGEVVVTIDDIRSTEGMLYGQVFRGEAGFAGEAAPVFSFTMEPAMPSTSLSVALSPGTYAIRIFHDVDGDGELDRTFLGIPSEPWATSNNAVGSFGPPNWNAVKFDVGDDVETQSINLIH